MSKKYTFKFIRHLTLKKNKWKFKVEIVVLYYMLIK